MSKDKESWLQRSNPELVAMLSLGVTILLAVLGQAVWLDGKIESLQTGQAAIRERLAALEASSRVAVSPAAGNAEPTNSAL